MDRAVVIEKFDGISRFYAESFADVDRDNQMSLFQILASSTGTSIWLVKDSIAARIYLQGNAA